MFIVVLKYEEENNMMKKRIKIFSKNEK